MHWGVDSPRGLPCSVSACRGTEEAGYVLGGGGAGERWPLIKPIRDKIIVWQIICMWVILLLRD